MTFPNSFPVSSTSNEEMSKLAAKIISTKPVYLDTETTGLEKQDEIVEISILDFDGTILFESYIRPVNGSYRPNMAGSMATNPWFFVQPTCRSVQCSI